jgi:hypothetical protein
MAGGGRDGDGEERRKFKSVKGKEKWKRKMGEREGKEAVGKEDGEGGRL